MFAEGAEAGGGTRSNCQGVIVAVIKPPPKSSPKYHSENLCSPVLSVIPSGSSVNLGATLFPSPHGL